MKTIDPSPPPADDEARRRFQRLRALFDELTELPPGERETRLEALRTESVSLHDELFELLADGTEADGVASALERLASPVIVEPAPGLGDAVGPYRLLRLLGEGGMGRVYEAEQSEPKRRVALKIMRHVEARSILARFDAERQALAVMDHAHIARMLDSGTTEHGRPWFAMELVEGESLTQWAERHDLGLEERIRLFLPICSAVHHAHAKGVVHRDLKPSNILVSRGEDGEAMPKVIDFGIAKAIDQPLLARTLATRLGELVGTPEYMSPEQATLGAMDVDTRSDVYALGLVLYELLVGELPLPIESLRGVAFDEVCRRIREDPTPKPSSRLGRRTGPASSRSATRRLRLGLDAVLLKALSKDRERRYESAAAFARDLERLLADEPVEAAAPKWTDHAAALVRRYRLAFALGALAVLSLLGGLAAATVGLLEARRSEAAAVAARLETESALRTSEETTGFVLRLFQASNPEENPGLELTARELLERGVERIDELADEPEVQAQLLETLGQVSWSLGAFDRAESIFESSLEARGLAPNAAQEAMTWTRLGDIHRRRADYEPAEKAYGQAIDRLESAGLADGEEMASALNSLGIVYTRLERSDDAADYLERAIAVLEAAGGNPVGAATIRANLANLYQSSGDAAKGLETARLALESFEEHLPANHPNLGVMHANISVSARGLGRLGLAFHHASRSVEIDREVLPPGHTTLADGLHGFGSVALRLGQVEQARAAFTEGLAIFDAADGPGHFNGTLHRASLAAVALTENDPASAIEWLEPVIAELAVRDGTRSSMHLVGYLRMHAVASRRLGELDAALESVERAYDLFDTIDSARFDPKGENSIFRLIQALLAFDAGQEERAESLFAEALELSGCDFGPHCTLDNQNNRAIRAHLHAARGEHDEALRTLGMALDHPGWSAFLLDAPELASLPRDDRWRALEKKLKAKLAETP